MGFVEEFCGIKRHPTIEDNVIIYAEATILGDVTIGSGSIIGGNVWLNESLPKDTIAIIAHRDLIKKKKQEYEKYSIQLLRILFIFLKISRVKDIQFVHYSKTFLFKLLLS